ncbi:MAG TPA: GrpB family protein [Anaerolineales bacterium]|nr:GrpB family protein [Anaerolineales bacterium]
MITIVPYRPEWPAEFLVLGTEMRQALGELAARIDHIGSTSVSGLAAKDIIDVQITVQDLDHPIERALGRIGYRRLEGIWRDHVPPGAPATESEWIKWIFRPPEGGRLANVHVRLSGRLNQRYPLLFRDYLRSHPASAEAYASVKRALAGYHPDNVDAYYDVKDPVCDIIMVGAEEWASVVGWQPGASDC